MTLPNTTAQTEPIEILYLGNTPHLTDTFAPTKIDICDLVPSAHTPLPTDFVVETLAQLTRPNDAINSFISQWEVASHSESSRLSHPQHDRRRPTHLRDYVCHAIASNTRDSPLLHDASSGTSHPLSHFVCYDKFFVSHWAYLAEITSVDEPRLFFSHSPRSSMA